MRLILMGCVLFLAACGGGGGGSSSSGGNDLPPTRPSGAVSGTAFDGLIVDGVVKVYSFSAGTKGALLGEGRTDFEGNYSVDFAAPDQPVLIEITGGRYIEEASSQNIPLLSTHRLRAVDFYVSGKPLTTNVTFYTNVASGLASFRVRQGTPVTTAITDANTRIGALIGLNITTTKPIDITNVSNAAAFLSDGLQYGFQTAAISQWTLYASQANGTLPHAVHHSIGFAQLAYDDIAADGKLDGVGSMGRLSVGTIPLGADVYRHALAVNVLKIAQNVRNRTGIKASDLIGSAKRYNDSTDPIFGGVPVIALDEGGPTISNIGPLAGTAVRATFNVTANVVDIVGVSTIEYLIDGNHYAYAGDVTVPIQFVVSTSFSDGPHTITIRATNLLGSVRSQDVVLVFDNAAPVITATSVAGKLVGSDQFCTVTGTVTDSGSGPKAVTVSGASSASLAGNVWTVDMPVTASDTYTISVAGTDAAGNTGTTNIAYHVIYLFGGYGPWCYLP